MRQVLLAAAANINCCSWNSNLKKKQNKHKMFIEIFHIHFFKTEKVLLQY